MQWRDLSSIIWFAEFAEAEEERSALAEDGIEVAMTMGLDRFGRCGERLLG